METKTSWKSNVDYTYLGSYSLAGKVNEVTLTISKVVKEKVTGEGGKVDNCNILYFKESAKDGVEVKPMVCNKTNCKTIQALYNSEFIDDWVGKKITIYVSQVKVGREMKDCLRIRNEVPSFKCSVCGKEIEEATYKASIAKYGKAYCSKECLDKDNDKGE